MGVAMFAIKVSAMKGGFFDSAKVIAKVDAAIRRNLSKAGAWIRRTARQSIRKRKKASRPGSPPSSHTGLLKDWILFSYDFARQSVVIGPAKLNATSALNLGAKYQPIPQTLEHGGDVIRTEYFSKQTKTWKQLTSSKSAKWVAHHGRPTRKRTVTIAARPFMKPAFDQNLPKLAVQWANSITSTAA